MNNPLRIFAPHPADPLLAERLPTVHRAELNYRTRPISSSFEWRIFLLVMLAPSALLISGPALAWVIELHVVFVNLLWAVSFFLVLRIGYLCLVGGYHRYELLWLLFIQSALASAWLWNHLSGDVLNAATFCVSWLASCWISRQIAAWMLVAPQVDRELMDRWRVNLPRVVQAKLSLDCPELLTYAVSPLIMAASWRVSLDWVQSRDMSWLWPVALITTLCLSWLVWHAATCLVIPPPNLHGSWLAAVRGLVVFITYDLYQTPAAGVFRFPNRWLRPLAVRWTLIAACNLLIGYCCYSAELPLAEAGGLFRALVTILWVCGMAPLCFLTIFWFVAGTLLFRFDRALSVADDDDDVAWDNYIDRIVNSLDDLEKQHVFLGATVTGDYPVLVHNKIYDQHFHVLGDSGARKTSLGLSPLATQLIARADASVVIIDLKGDNAFFQTCRIEAARTRQLRFRWISNEVDKTTFGFNPFLQKHNQQLTLEQLTQQILRGLSLDYGIDYGKGYYTAMNEIVLNTILKRHNVRSFRELAEALNDKNAYKQIGEVDDWKESRQLGALVSRLAGTEALNITPDRYVNYPHVHRQAIDCLELFTEPQVIYLCLSSATEPTNAPAIARLFLWACFNAASRRPSGSHHVYFLIDEIQQIVSDGMKLIFEQFRGIGGSIVAAHQTAAQLRREGTDLGATIDSCTAAKQAFRASDLESIQGLEEIAGSQMTKVENWNQTYELGTGTMIDRFHPMHARDGQVNVRQMNLPVLDRKRILETGAEGLSSLVRFTFNSGYTCFGGATVPINSIYPISELKYQDRERMPWPQAAGAVSVPGKLRLKQTQRKQSPKSSNANDIHDQLDKAAQLPAKAHARDLTQGQ